MSDSSDIRQPTKMHASNTCHLRAEIVYYNVATQMIR